jgi:hypothetical protein
MGDDPAAAPALEERVERLESGQESVLGKLDELLARGHATAGQHEADRLDRPSAIEEQVRAELDRAERERQAAADADAEKTERATIREQIARLAERPPAAPVPRRQRVIWGKP